MKIKKVNHLYQISFLADLFPVNCYLIEEEYDLTLIDCAMPFSKKGILKAAERIGKPIKRIVLTHAHDDHVGALDALVEQLADVEVLIPERELKLLQGNTALEEGEGHLPIKGGFPKKIKTAPNTLLREGDKIGSLVAIHAPGHTPGLMAYVDTRDNSLIAGDAFQTRGGLAVSGQIRWIFPFPALATWNKQKAIQSAEKLLTYSPSVLAVGHGKLLVNPVLQIENAIKQAKRSL